MNTKKKGIIFDKDGTLFDTESMYNELWFEMSQEPQYAGLNPNTLETLKGLGGQKLVDGVQEREPDFNGQALIDDLFHRADIRQLENLPIKPGAIEIIHYLKERGFKIAIASSSTSFQIRQNMKTAGIEDMVDDFVSGEDVANSKPAPDSFLQAAKKLGLDPSECYAVEDSYHGIRSAHSAGCFTIMIPDLIIPDETFAEYYDDLSKDFFEVMDKIEKGLI